MTYIDEISWLDVKELYDAAYAEKAEARGAIGRFRSLLAQAEGLDALYRSQLAAHSTQSWRRAA
jgi:hypothetical protein